MITKREEIFFPRRNAYSNILNFVSRVETHVPIYVYIYIHSYTYILMDDFYLLFISCKNLHSFDIMQLSGAHGQREEYFCFEDEVSCSVIVASSTNNRHEARRSSCNKLMK